MFTAKITFLPKPIVEVAVTEGMTVRQAFENAGYGEALEANLVPKLNGETTLSWDDVVPNSPNQFGVVMITTAKQVKGN